ncbi:hypothetical protein [Sphingomonas koreensis]
MTRADTRPRVHIVPHADGASWSLGPSATRHGAFDPGSALNNALETLGDRASKGVVVIVEPVL